MISCIFQCFFFKFSIVAIRCWWLRPPTQQGKRQSALNDDLISHPFSRIPDSNHLEGHKWITKIQNRRSAKKHHGCQTSDQTFGLKLHPQRCHVSIHHLQQRLPHIKSAQWIFFDIPLSCAGGHLPVKCPGHNRILEERRGHWNSELLIKGLGWAVHMATILWWLFASCCILLYPFLVPLLLEKLLLSVVNHCKPLHPGYYILSHLSLCTQHILGLSQICTGSVWLSSSHSASRYSLMYHQWSDQCMCISRCRRPQFMTIELNLSANMFASFEWQTGAGAWNLSATKLLRHMGWTWAPKDGNQAWRFPILDTKYPES